MELKEFVMMNRSIEHIELNYFHCFETERAEFASHPLNTDDRIIRPFLGLSVPTL